MKNNHTSYICPFCEGELKSIDEAFTCLECKKNYLNILGIYDFTGEYDSVEELLRDDKKARTLYENFDKGDYSFLTGVNKNLCKEWLDGLPESLRNVKENFNWNMMEQRGKTEYEKVKASIKKYTPNTNYGVALDVGCSSGATLFYIADDYDHSVGIDPYLPELILAQKYIQENGIKNITLIRGYAESAPFKENSFDFIHALNVVEHIADQKKAISSMHRLLNHGGVLCFDSSNRYDIFKPEPHVKVRFVGFFPQKLQAKYVKFMKNIEYRNTRLLSYFELKRLMRPAFKGNFKIAFPELTSSSNLVNAIYSLLKKIPVISFIFKLFFPTYQVVGVKKGAR